MTEIMKNIEKYRVALGFDCGSKFYVILEHNKEKDIWVELPGRFTRKKYALEYLSINKR